MLFTKLLLSVFTLFVSGIMDSGDTIILTGLNSQEWIDFKRINNKTYTPVQESYAQFYYSYNRQVATNHNVLADRNQKTFRLGMNQFSDLRLIQFNQLFPKTTQFVISHATLPPMTQEPSVSFDPLVDLGVVLPVEDQGTVCNSGWAYATAKAIELMQALQTGNPAPARLSAQNLIDCAGASRGCIIQVPQAAFDYLTQYGQGLHLEINYRNNKYSAQQGMCLSTAIGNATYLEQYASIKDADDTTMKRYVAAGYPVVIELNPTTFEFMLYSSGIFQPPRTANQGSHFMAVIGFGTDSVTGLDYWLVQNSFGTGWGEVGRIRIIRNAANPLAKSALFPTGFRA